MSTNTPRQSNVRLESSLREALEVLAKVHDRSLSAELREAVRFYVKANSQ